MELKVLALASWIAVGAGCSAAAPSSSRLPGTALASTHGGARDVRQLAADAPFTVLIFFSRACHCLDQHDARIRALYDAYHPQGVQLVMVDMRAPPVSLPAKLCARAGEIESRPSLAAPCFRAM